MQFHRFIDMLQDGTLDMYAVLQTLAHKVRQINGGIDADGLELDAIIGSFRKFGFWQNPILRHNALVPRITFHKTAEKRCCISPNILLTVEDESIC